ncbi:mitochondrial protein Pet127-domain-containing protein [Daedaleopsis nitida]|nr:mitochondrial protein Pet127-domain-containing protein [Daedaleopsis nitida]
MSHSSWTTLAPRLHRHTRLHSLSSPVLRALHSRPSPEPEPTATAQDGQPFWAQILAIHDDTSPQISSSRSQDTTYDSIQERTGPVLHLLTALKKLASSGDIEETNSTKKRRSKRTRLQAAQAKLEQCVTSIDKKGVIPDSQFKPLKDVRAWKRHAVPKLAHGLEAVLTRPGVHWLKDPEQNEYRFDKYLETIPKVEDFDFDKLGGFVPSSQDRRLIDTAKQAACKYAGSTSSLTGILAQIYLLLSEEKHLNTSHLSPSFGDAPRFFTFSQRLPASVILRYKDGVYATDYDAERDSTSTSEEMILLPLGTLLEKFLTTPPSEFSKLLKTNVSDDYPRFDDVHRYAKYGKFVMRSQLDCIHDSLPGTGVFDLKTRAISAVRHDVYNYRAYAGNTLESLTGRRGSFEEEYYDMIRSAFLEYSFQARIGNMDGIMVAYHNVARIFGFQYISLKEMDLSLFGHAKAGQRVFLRCVHIMGMLYDEIVKCFKAQPVKCTFEKRGKFLRVWVEPIEFELKNILHGQARSGPYAVYSVKYPWSIEYNIKRYDGPAHQAAILERRDRAYKRQMSLGDFADTDVDLRAKAVGEAKAGAASGPSVDVTDVLDDSNVDADLKSEAEQK